MQQIPSRFSLPSFACSLLFRMRVPRLQPPSSLSSPLLSSPLLISELVQSSSWIKCGGCSRDKAGRSKGSKEPKLGDWPVTASPHLPTNSISTVRSIGISYIVATCLRKTIILPGIASRVAGSEWHGARRMELPPFPLALLCSSEGESHKKASGGERERGRSLMTKGMSFTALLPLTS